MSYEGREQTICNNGHYSEYSCYSVPFVCSCGAKIVWKNSIDDTNCDEMGIIPNEKMDQFVIEPEVIQTCNLVHYHIVKPAKYRIPNKAETMAARCFYHADTYYSIDAQGENLP